MGHTDAPHGEGQMGLAEMASTSVNTAFGEKHFGPFGV